MRKRLHGYNPGARVNRGASRDPWGSSGHAQLVYPSTNITRYTTRRLLRPPFLADSHSWAQLLEAKMADHPTSPHAEATRPSPPPSTTTTTATSESTVVLIKGAEQPSSWRDYSRHVTRRFYIVPAKAGEDPADDFRLNRGRYIELCKECTERFRRAEAGEELDPHSSPEENCNAAQCFVPGSHSVSAKRQRDCNITSDSEYPESSSIVASQTE
ncbi:hypothetical protein DFH27DRAFT_608300 [Peziza echinospora]|nr:hypothetical protein DFH27DRAFT_608300 [Peziza echinospora]